MPSTQQHTLVRGQANLHDFAESNSNKRLKKVHKFNMQPAEEANINPHADDQLLPKQAAAHAGQLEKEEAAALLHHMQHADHHDHASADRMYIDHDNGYGAAAGDQARIIVDRGMLQPPARENSGSSDGSAAYFSGDSDLTAEPIMGRSCGTDDNEADGAKSSNSGSSSTPLLKPKNSLTLRIDQTHPAPFNSAGLGAQAYSVNHPILNEKACNVNEEVGYASHMASTTALFNLAPSTSTTSASRRCKDPETLMASPEMMRTAHAQEQQISGYRQCSSSPLESADCGRHLTESWLELRLGSLPESTRQGQMEASQNYDGSRDEQRKWRESEYANAMEQERVTLQLLPEVRPKVTETCSGAGSNALIKPSMPVQNPPVAAVSGLYRPSSIPPAYHPPTSATFLHNATPFDMSNVHRLTSGAVPPEPCGHPLLHNQTRDPTATSSQYVDQFLHLNQSSNQSYRHPVLSGSYERRANAFHHMQEGHGHRRWASSEPLMDMMVAGVTPSTPVNISTSAQPPEIYRPTASLGWPPGTALVPGADGRSWSASSIYNTPQAQIQNNISWQGLLRSMANDPLLHAHTLRDVSMHSFDDGAILQTPGMRRRHMFPPACTRPPSSHASTSALAAHQRLRLASSRRSSDLWFSLQEADNFPNEKDQQLSDHCMQKRYLRIRDGKMQISVVKSYLIKKLGLAGSHHYNPDEVDITCRGQILSPSLTMQHVRDTIWLSKDVVEVETIGFRFTANQINNSQNRVMALCYQRHHTSQTLTLNLLKI